MEFRVVWSNQKGQDAYLSSNAHMALLYAEEAKDKGASAIKIIVDGTAYTPEEFEARLSEFKDA
jgi:hypothetical protein